MRRTNVEEIEGPVGGSEKDIEWQRIQSWSTAAGSSFNGTVFWGTSAVTAWEQKLRMVVVQPLLL